VCWSPTSTTSGSSTSGSSIGWEASTPDLFIGGEFQDRGDLPLRVAHLLRGIWRNTRPAHQGWFD
jgi:hypothetical protein